jgi:hypothetical protein
MLGLIFRLGKADIWVGFDGPLLCANCLPTAQNSVETGAITRNATCKYPDKTPLFNTQRKCENEPQRDCKTFIQLSHLGIVGTRSIHPYGANIEELCCRF